MGIITRVGEERIAQLANLRRETVQAVAICNDGPLSIVATVERIGDGEHAGDLVYIETDLPGRVPAIEFDGRRFESRAHSIGAWYWEEVPV